MRRPARFPTLAFVTAILVIAAILRLVNLTRLPAGFNPDELTDLRVSETVRLGNVASFYNVGNPAGGREGLYPIFQGVITLLIGDGFLFYRILSVWCGLLSVALTFVLGRRLLGRYGGMGAAMAMTVTLWPLLLSRTASRETLLLPLALAALFTLTHAFHLRRTITSERPITVSFTVLGVLIAALIYTHWTSLMFLPLLVVFLVYLILTRQRISRRVVGSSAYALLVTIILGIPYLTFTLRSAALSGFHVYWANRPPNLGALLQTTLQTLASLFVRGDPLVYHNVPGLPLLNIGAAILFLIGLIVALTRWRTPGMALIVLTLVIGLIPGAWARTAPDFTNIVLALPAVMLLIALGLLTVVRQLWKVTDPYDHKPTRRLSIVLVMISLFLVSRNLFLVWPNVNGFDEAYHAQLGYLAAYLDRTYDGLTTSICTYNLKATSGNQFSDPVLLPLMLHRIDVKVRFSDCVNGLVLTNGGELQRLAFINTAINTLPPVFREWLNSAQPVTVKGLPPGSVVQLDVHQELADAFGKLTLQYVAWAPETGVTSRATLPIRMGGYLTFQGYTILSGKTYKPGDQVTLVTYWRADGPQVPDLRVFMHILRNPNSEPVRQNDLLSVDPTSLQDRDVFVQVITVPLPTDFPPGEYYMSIGAYSNTTETRIPVYEANQERGDRLFLDTITVSQ